MEKSSVESTTPVYTLSTTSVLSGIPVHSIRQYIDKGLIIPFRKESNRNLFSQVDILRLKYIQNLLNRHGLNIAGIRTLMALIPCWSITKCSLTERETCQAYHSDTDPCRDASEKKGDIYNYAEFVKKQKGLVAKRRSALLTNTPNHVVFNYLYREAMTEYPIIFEIFSTLPATLVWLGIPIEFEGKIKTIINDWINYAT